MKKSYNFSNQVQNSEITVGLVGDVMIGRLVNEALQKAPPHFIWGDLIENFYQCDLRLINLEAALTKSEREVEKVFNFKSDPEHVASLKIAHIDVVNLANNHCLDYDVEGLYDTLTTLDEAGIAHVGAGRNFQEAQKAAIFEKKGIRIGIIGYTDNEPDWLAGKEKPGINFIEIRKSDAILEAISKLKKTCDIPIVTLHWGPNMVQEPPREFIEFAHWLIDNGVRIIHGHSAHLFQGVERYKEGLILYDTGDFIDDYYVDPYLRNDQSFFFQVTVTKEKITRLLMQPIHISNCSCHLAQGKEADEICLKMELLSKLVGTKLERVPTGLQLIM